MKLELKITKSTGIFNLNPEKNTRKYEESTEFHVVDSQVDFDRLMAGFFGDWQTIADIEYKRIIVGCSNVYKNDNLFICIKRENHEIVRAEAMARAYIRQGFAVLMGKPEIYKPGECPIRLPQMIVTGIASVQNFKDFEDTYYNTKVFVKRNPDYQWLTDESVDDAILL